MNFGEAYLLLLDDDNGGFPPLISSIQQWLTGTTVGESVDDKLDPLIVSPEPVIGDVGVLEFGGTDTITSSHLIGTETAVSWDGTSASIVITAGTITPSAGTVANIILSDGTSYTCQEVSGLTVGDNSGNGNDGTLSAGVTRTTADGIPSANAKGGHNKNLYFDGTASLDCGAPLIGLGDFTISFKLLANIDANDRYIMSQYIATDSGRFSIATRAGGAIRMSIGFAADSSVGKYIVGSSANIGIVYVAATKTVSFYFDGVYDKSVTVAGFGVVYQGTNTLIGTLLANYLDGCIDDLFIKNSALDSIEIGALHAGTYAGLADTKYPSKNAYIKDGEVYLPDAEGDDDATGTNVNIIYNSALPFKSKSVLTINNATTDKLTVVGLAETDVVTCSGTAVPTAGIGEITFTVGTAYDILINNELVYSCNTLGKATATLTSLSVLWPDAGVVVGAGGLESFWSKRIEDASGVLVASDYNLITNHGILTNPDGYISNGSEVSRSQSPTATELLDGVNIAAAGLEYFSTYIDDLNSRPRFDVSATPYGELKFNGANWQLATGTGSIVHPTATGQYPPKTGWPDYLGVPVSVDYNSPYIDDNGDLKKLFYADDLARVNLTEEVLDKWEDIDGVCHLKEQGNYKQGTFASMTLSDYNKADNWSGDDCGAGIAPFEVLAVDADGELATDADGELATDI